MTIDTPTENRTTCTSDDSAPKLHLTNWPEIIPTDTKSTTQKLKPTDSKLIKRNQDTRTKHLNAKLESLETQDNAPGDAKMLSFAKTLRHSANFAPTQWHAGATMNRRPTSLANTFIDNYTENKRPGKHTTNIDSDVTNTLTRFSSTPPSSPISPTDPDEICDYMKKTKKLQSTWNR
ncbi:hypothetical protein TNCV_406771 [Trichonephila clavipes]|nr:hypothetical protein TNCV_406771 [Trichonephila clavipes]